MFYISFYLGSCCWGAGRVACSGGHHVQVLEPFFLELRFHYHWQLSIEITIRMIIDLIDLLARISFLLYSPELIVSLPFIPLFDFALEYQVRPVDDPRGTRERQLHRNGRRRDAITRPRPAGRAHLRRQPLDSWPPSLPISSMFQVPWRRHSFLLSLLSRGTTGKSQSLELAVCYVL